MSMILVWFGGFLTGENALIDKASSLPNVGRSAYSNSNIWLNALASTMSFDSESCISVARWVDYLRRSFDWRIDLKSLTGGSICDSALSFSVESAKTICSSSLMLLESLVSNESVVPSSSCTLILEAKHCSLTCESSGSNCLIVFARSRSAEK